MTDYKYSIVTPVRNEEKVIARTMQSVITQTVRPVKWVIVDDGSEDNTGQIIDRFAAKYEWIEVLHGQKEMRCYEGVHKKLSMAFERIDPEANEFIGKLDADIELGPTYYEDLFREFGKDGRLGIAGGTLYTIISGKNRIESCPKYHVRGGLKLYRVQCWKDIGGMEFKLGYDTIDEIKAQMLGWKSQSFEHIRALHHRPTGQGKGIIGSSSYFGKVAFLVGYHPLFLVCKSVRDMVKKPYILGGCAEMWGFFRCYLNGTQRSIDDKKVIKFLRKRQMERLLCLRSHRSS